MIEHRTLVHDTISDYGRKSTFSSFLPGIAGVKGIPIWCYYVNRGQAVVSFGVRDKDHSIMEFYPAHAAYQTVKRTGFRTFVRADGEYFEPFKKAVKSDQMTIYMNGLGLSEESYEAFMTTTVDYTALPGEDIGALLRVVTIRNDSDKNRHFEVLDGCPALVPYGVGQESLKVMTQTTKAWMQVEDLERKVPYYRVRVSMEDSAVVKKVDGGNFGLAVDDTGVRLPVIADPGVIFDYDYSLENPEGFINGGAGDILSSEQNTSNEFPCLFFVKEADLGPGEEMSIYEIIGQVRNREVLDKFLSQRIDASFFRSKFAEADDLTDDLTKAVATKTADPVFDSYTRVNFMDNVLRGGSPIDLNGHVFYVYSRKHGDLERDYNYFSMTPEFFSQGNGNFRDVNQNRRCDSFFSPVVGTRNIEMFYSLLQLDGYNPLKIEQIKYEADEEDLNGLDITSPFTPGELYAALTDAGEEDIDERFDRILKGAKETVNAEFGEGYWSDHWTYNLDLIEDYLEVYPDREKALLFDTLVSSFDCKEKVLPRSKRYVKTESGIRQYRFLESRDTQKNGSFAVDRKGREIRMPLISKMVLLSAVKFASIDSYGMGIEMDGGKPGWYDALNGMPGLFGSSMNETYELQRMLDFIVREMEKQGQALELNEEAAGLIRALYECEKAFSEGGYRDDDLMENWNKRNNIREAYREVVYDGLSGEKEVLDAGEVLTVLRCFKERLKRGIDRALILGDGISPSYFTFDCDKYEEADGKITALHFDVVKVPDFLEGPVRYLKLDASEDEKRTLYKKVRESDLFDKELNMYKVNASLMDSSFELGRCRAFTPGWLENESIWLHMEYKYLLELLRSGLYPEFFDDFKKMAIPFLDKDKYGRSTLENSSFIASSKNPNKKIRGKGFVARLSGSTIEFISMWKLMFFGKDMFRMEGSDLVFSVSPAIPSYLLYEDGGKYRVSATLLGDITVNYEADKKADYYPGNYEITNIRITMRDGSKKDVEGALLRGEDALLVRDNKASSLDIKITEK